MKSNFSNENKVIILFVSLINLYDHLVITLLYDNTIYIFKNIIDSLIEYYHLKKDSCEPHGERLYVKGRREYLR
ncbi:unnamed protein product [Spirodela intermedia]|uniref:Uncharacterized protein n=1 Tax=Spirodela intermedia TaxID=51605 RepID=A0A7I8KLL6_SPIIN|nr:unnamed protein product [Spirodela intermedia]